MLQLAPEHSVAASDNGVHNAAQRPIERVLARCADVRRSGDGYIGRCPAHDDRRPSLSVREGSDGRVLVRCHRGCETADVVAGLGLSLADLFPAAIGEAQRARTWKGADPIPALRVVRHELREGDGRHVATHCREVDPVTGKKAGRVWWESPDGTRGLNGVRAEDLPLFGQDTLCDLVEATAVFVVEGEPAATALQWCGVPAVATVTGAATIPSEGVLRPLARFRPILWADNDEPGREHMRRIALQLELLGCTRVTVVEWSDAPAKGDARDFIDQLRKRGLPQAEMAAAVGTLPAVPWKPRVGSTPSVPPSSASAVMDPAAFHGLAGEVVSAIDMYSEADPAAVLASLLVAFGNCVGPGPHVLVGSTLHSAREYIAVVGNTAMARKGESWSPVRRLMSRAAPEWAASQVQGGLSSGEGVIAAVRDPVEEVDRKTGEHRIIDAGVADKRLLIVEPELARTLRVMRRDGSTLSAVIRDSWDSGNLRVMTKTQARATGAHLGCIGHITEDELVRELDDSSVANGFANRFLWLHVKRSKLLPEPEPFDGPVVDRLAEKIAEAVRFASGVRAVVRDDDARRVWRDVYPELTAPKPGMLGAVLSRAEAHAVRLSLIYALLDMSPTIRRDHLEAALAVVDYAEVSARRIFGERLGDPVADAIVAALADRELTRDGIRDVFGRHQRSARIAVALDSLVSAGQVVREVRETGGRPAEVWRRIR